MPRIPVLLITCSVILIICGCHGDEIEIAGPSSNVTWNGSDPIACWNFDENGGYTAADNCNGHDAILSGPPSSPSWVTGKCGSALRYDGEGPPDTNGEWVEMPGGAWLTQLKGTVEAWVKIDPDATGGRIISTETGGWHNGFHMGYATMTGNNQPLNGAILCGIHSTEDGNHYAECYIDNVSKGEWHFIAFVWDGDANSVMVFVDGATCTSISPHPGIMDTGEPLTIGCWKNTGYLSDYGGWFNGCVDEVKFYDRPLSVDELIAHYNAPCRPGRFVYLDIKPGSCPNPINPRSKGVLPVAILGTVDLDVNDIDVSSLLLEGVAPIRSSIEDVSTLTGPKDECDCAEGVPDGYEDLTLKFRTPDIVNVLGPVFPGETKVLSLTGNFLDGTPFESKDCVFMVGRCIKAFWLFEGNVGEEAGNQPGTLY